MDLSKVIPKTETIGTETNQAIPPNPEPTPKQTIPEPVVEPTPEPVQEPVLEIKFQHYECARQSTKLLTPTGRAIIFINHEFITSDEGLIEYLNNEIANGLRDVTKGALMTAAEADPMAALKAKWIEEGKKQAQQEAEQAALGVSADMGDTRKSKVDKLNAISTQGINQNAAGSSSGISD